ncbi:DUF6520 family protein [Membranihabitans maritimus]|uniref:DUF6520 family protein n=1 Tax=Membranihabitans maritimus TaxID=2904244 RepID=UPI001F31CF1B|nr:DUF6520 family protein [Membranihabitans maritimus]
MKHLPALAAAVAVTLALAFTPKEAVDGFGTPDGGETWYDTSQPGIEYECNEPQTENCIYALPDTNSQVLQTGRFELQ